MWQLSHPILKTAEFNFAGAGKTTVAQLWQDDVCLVNAFSQVNWDDTAANFQFEVCQCGYLGCAPGGWVSLRRAGSMGLILPAFQKNNGADGALIDEYQPPWYLIQRGAMWLEQQIYTDKLRGAAPSPDFDQLPGLTSQEAAKLFQWEAPHQVLGSFHSWPKLVPDVVIASSEGSFLEQVPVLTALIDQLLNAGDWVTLRPVQPQEQVITFYLDLAGIPHWNALVYDGIGYKLYLEPGYVLEVPY